jgi:hypothetical protein
MKLSAFKDHPYYNAMQRLDNLEVIFNKQKTDYVVTLNTEEGWIERYHTTELGKPVIDTNGNVVMQRLHGKVEVFQGGILLA